MLCVVRIMCAFEFIAIFHYEINTVKGNNFLNLT